MKLYVASIFVAIALLSVFSGHVEADTDYELPDARCNSDFALYDEGTRMCYCLNKKAKNWDDARAFCQARGGDLAVIVNQEINDKLTWLANRFCDGVEWDVWFGLSGLNGQGEFEWVDGSTFGGFTNFDGNDDPPDRNGRCFCLSDEPRVPVAGQWFDFRCNAEQFFFCQASGPTSACCDPHFMVHVRGMHDPVCFDYYGKDKDTLQLVYDPEDDFIVNGEIFTHGHTTRSWFGALSFLVPGCQITANIEGITINEKMYEWTSMDYQKCGNTSVTFSVDADPSARAAHLTIFVRPGVQFVFSTDHRKYNFGDIIYMNFEIDEQYGLDQTTNGLLGHFMGMEVSLDKESLSNHTHSGILFFPDEPGRGSIAAKSVKRKVLHTHEYVPCWLVKNEGEGLVRGTVRDYLVPDLLTNKLAQDFKHVSRKEKNKQNPGNVL